MMRESDMMKLTYVNRSRWVWIGLSAAVLAGGLVWVGQQWTRPSNGGVTLAGHRTWSLMGAANEVESTASAPVSNGKVRSLSSIRAAVFGDPLISQTQPAGDWCVEADGHLRPDVALRQRFEYYLLALGNATPDEIRLVIQDEARKAVGDKAAAAIMAIYDKYMALRSAQPRNQLVLNDRESWQPAFEEQKAMRRQYLGQEWADAFFKAEEDEFVQFTAQVDQKAGPDRKDMSFPVPQMGPGKDAAAVYAERVSLYGEAAAKRLAKADADWADWESRLNAGKAEWQRLSNSPELSDTQRKQSMDQYIDGHFPPDERMRARGLIY